MQIFPQKSSKIIFSETGVNLGGGLSIEWKWAPGAPTPTGMSATYEEIDGVPCYRIRTSAEKDWVRLHLELPVINTQAILGARFLINIVRGPETPKLKPYLVQSNIQNRSRGVLPGTVAERVTLRRAQWFEIVGAFSCVPVTGPHKIDVVLDLPKQAEILVAEVAGEWFPVPASDAKNASIIRAFEPRAVTDIANWQESPPVYAVSAELRNGVLSGWAITRTKELFAAHGTQTIPVALSSDPSVQPGSGIAVPGAFSQMLAPGAGTQTPVRLLGGREALEPLWMGRQAEGQATTRNSLEQLLRFQTAAIKDFRLHLEGTVIHPVHPGMPVRLDLVMGDERIRTVIARSVVPAADTKSPGDQKAFRFTVNAPIHERQLNTPLFVHFTEFPDHPPVHVPLIFQDEDKSASKQYEALDVPVPQGAEVIGNIEGVSKLTIEGWAICPEAPDAQVELVLLLNGKPVNYTKTRNYRKDVQAIYAGAGFCGFVFEVPPNMSIIDKDALEVQSLNGVSKLRKSRFSRTPPPGHNEGASLPAPRAHVPGLTLTTGPRISVIVLNRNGASLLEEMFSSCAPKDLSGDIEWIVVDHNSEDESEDVCARHAAQGKDIRFYRRLGNYSFSESNNFGVEKSTGDLLIFANNDLVFLHPFGDVVRSYLSDASVGMLGVRLLDHIDDPARQNVRIDQHLGVFFQGSLTAEDWIRPYEARLSAETVGAAKTSRAVAVTGAFCAMRRDDFLSLGGFDETYSYGLEDVDLCLKVQLLLRKEIICTNDISIVHHRGFSRKLDNHSGIRRRKNNEVFNHRWGSLIRRKIKQSVVSDPGVWTGNRPVFAFVVADVGDATSAGEFYTSLEMGRALQRIIPCHVRYIPESDWYDLSGVDVLVAMVNRFDVNKIRKASPWLITINWMRQWFDRWAEDPTVPGYDYLFASSETAARYLEDALNRKVETMPIASEYNTFADAEVNPDFACDYCFTGSRFGFPREVEFQLDPTRVHGEGKVFGYNWEGTPFKEISAGPVAYSKISQVYASTKIVIDDANIATKPWGSCNSRVFDAMAGGALLITNGKIGAEELFGDLVPTFDSSESLTATLNYWLTHEDERKERAAKLQKIIETDHRYDTRAKQLLNTLTGDQPIRISIKCAAIYKQKEQWGDYHYAESLAVALRKLGYVVRVDCRESWYSGISVSDDVVIVLRGLVSYKLRPHQKNIFWIISHPNDVSIAEMASYDHVYIASQHHADALRNIVQSPIEFMPQCTDIGRFSFVPERVGTAPDRNLYVANSRGVFREPVKWAIQRELQLDIYGVGWEPFIQDNRFKGRLVPNSVLGEIYASSRLVICDHWADMSDLGYVANRVFDVLASGGRLIVDNVRGLSDLVPDEYYDVFRDEEEFTRLIRTPVEIDMDQRRRAAEWTAQNHSFDARASTFSKRIEQLLRDDAETVLGVRA